ncbi:MAG: hypothetical protein HND53_00145 [Proteobacteria bacterium]|nr:hypothetical protein [Pseudomonadota bacterium]
MSKEKHRNVTTRNEEDEPSPELIEMLANTPKESIKRTEEDRQWLNMPAVGREIIEN